MTLSLSAHYNRLEEESLIPQGVGSISAADFRRDYEIGDLLGKGAYSIVRAARSRKTGRLYACKIIDKRKVPKASCLRDEIRILCSVTHHGIVSLHELVETSDELLLLTDLAMGGELYDRIVKNQRYKEGDARLVIRLLLEAVHHLHMRHIIHRDIKPENILLSSVDSDTDVKLSDFGLAKVCDDAGLVANPDGVDSEQQDFGRARAYTSCGTDYYVAPEVLLGEGYGIKVDLWSIGVVAYVLLCGFPPFVGDGDDMSSVYKHVLSGSFSFPSPSWDYISADAKDFVSRLLTVDPERRLSCQQALEHRWITQ